MKNEGLMEMAADARNASYSPYSEFAVGAALRTASGKVYTGSNIENASYGLTICAERVAVFKAVNDGERKLTELAICGPENKAIFPCGACLQVLAEFSSQLTIYFHGENGEIIVKNISELLPFMFQLNNN